MELKQLSEQAEGCLGYALDELYGLDQALLNGQTSKQLALLKERRETLSLLANVSMHTLNLCASEVTQLLERVQEAIAGVDEGEEVGFGQIGPEEEIFPEEGLEGCADNGDGVSEGCSGCDAEKYRNCDKADTCTEGRAKED